MNKIVKKISDRFNKGVFIIAEAGVNHNGNLQIAKRMIIAAANAGVDAIKFQTFKAENLASIYAPKAKYQKEAAGPDRSQLDMLKELELSPAAHKKLITYCEKRDIMFLSSPFDLDSVELLDKLGLDIFKIPSGEITNLPYLEKIGSLKKRILLSSGMSNLKEIKAAIKILVTKGTLKENIVVMHCCTNYPAGFDDINLKAILTLKKSLRFKIGYSDHATGIEASIAAAALGACVIEKHFTLSRKMKGPDHKASLEPQELKNMVTSIRNIELAMGDGIKHPAPGEIENIGAIRKSIVALCPIKRGDTLTSENMAVKRPAIGISPMKWHEVKGKKAIRDFKKDDFIIL